MHQQRRCEVFANEAKIPLAMAMNVTRSPSRLNWSESAAGALARNVIFPLWAWRNHPHYRRYVEEFERTQFLDLAALRALQLRRLQALVAHAYANCSFYRPWMDRAGFRPNHLVSLEQVSVLPVLTKRDIQDHGAELVAAQFPPTARIRNQTGGSTGSPLQFYVDRERFDSRLASTVRHNRWTGLRPGDWCADLWGARLDQFIGSSRWDRLRNYFLYRTISLNTSCIRPGDWSAFIAELRRRRPRFLLAYAQAAVLFADYLRENDINDVHFDSILTTAEVLLPGQRQLLEGVFQGRVFNRYGCREVSVIASECERHEGLHVNAEALLVEVLPDGEISPPAGRIVITDLLNYSMPLIRYEIGDAGSWAPRPCSCGRGLPLLDDVQGRVTDFLILPDGRRISGPALTLVVADMSEVRQVQFVQPSLYSIILRVVPGSGYGVQTGQELRKRLSHYLDRSVTLSVTEVERIATEASGKHRFVISDLPQPYAAAQTVEVSPAKSK